MHTVCKILVVCNATEVCGENKVIIICVPHQDHIFSVIPNGGVLTC